MNDEMDAPPTAHGSPPLGAGPPLNGIDRELLQASRDVDRSLLRWYLTLSPMQRLEASSSAAAGLYAFRRVSPEAS